MPVSQLVDDTPFCCTNRRSYGLLTYLLNKQGSNIPCDNCTRKVTKDEQIMVTTRGAKRASKRQRPVNEDDVNEGVAAKASVAKSTVSSEDEKGQYDSEVGSPNALVAKVNGDNVEGKLKFTVTTQQHTQNNV